MGDTVGLIAEIFTWIGAGLGVGLLLIALIARLADGDWVAVRAVVEQTDHGPVVRWFDDDGNVNEAPLGAADVRHIGSRDMADIHYRRGWRNRMRIEASSHAVRFLVRLGLLMLGVGLAAFVIGWIPLIIERW